MGQRVHKKPAKMTVIKAFQKWQA